MKRYLFPRWASESRDGLLRALLVAAMAIATDVFAAPRVSVATPGFWPQPVRGDAKAVKVSGSYAYVTVDTGSLVVLDMSDRSRPVLVGQCAVPGTGLNLDFVGSHAYVAASSNGLQVVEVTDPAQPMRVGGVDLGGAAWDVQVQGRYAYVTVRGVGLVVLDLNDPSHPAPVGTFPLDGTLWHLHVVGNLVYVAATDRLEIIDATDPAHLSRAGRFVAPTGDRIADVRVVGGYAWLAGKGLDVLDVNDPAHVTLVASAPRYYDSGALQIVGRTAVITEQLDRLVLFDIADPNHPAEAGEIYVGYAPTDLDVAGTALYVAVADSGLQVIDLADPTQPVRGGGFGIGGSARSVRVSGQHAFVTDSRGGLEILDISNPTRPKWVGGFFTGGYVTGLQLVGDKLFLGDQGYGLFILDVSVPEQPSVIGQVVPSSPISGFGIVGTHAVLGGSTDVQILDVSDPAKPLNVATWQVEPAYGVVFGLAVAGRRAFVGVDLDPGLVQDVLDITDPAHPVFQGTLGDPADGWAFAIAAAEAGEHALMVLTTYELRVYDGSVPGLPVLVNRFHTHYPPFAIHVEAQRAYVSEAGPGIEVIDVADPLHLRSLGFLSTPDLIDPFVADHRLYAAGWDRGLAIIPNLPGVAFTVQADGVSGLPLTLEAATDFGPGASWSPVLTNNSPQMPIWFTEADVSGPRRFYRARQP